MLRLGFHYHIPAARRDGAIYVPGYLGRFLDGLGRHCEQVICFSHTPRVQEGVYMDYRISSCNIKLVEIGPHVDVPRRTIAAGIFARPIKEWRTRLDALLLRGPSPLLPAMARAAGDLPVALLLVGDYVAGISDLRQPPWRKEAIRIWSKWNQRQQTCAAKRSLTFVNSRKLYEELRPIVPHLIETHTTTLSAIDFFEREDTCTFPPYYLLYSGRINRAKGLFDVVEALAILVSRGEDIVFDLVGWHEDGDDTLDELIAFAAQRGVADRVRYRGYKTVGPELFACYKEADIYVIASRSSSEGFPRTIWEAMAHSLPVVATKVGSIPHFLQGTAELVEPGDVDALVLSVSHLIHTPSLRQRRIQCGMQLARQNTLETQIEKMVRHLEDWIRKRP
jgi:glycosyltransferase involved in cell wall biosynthesis